MAAVEFSKSTNPELPIFNGMPEVILLKIARCLSSLTRFSEVNKRCYAVANRHHLDPDPLPIPLSNFYFRQLKSDQIFRNAVPVLSVDNLSVSFFKLLQLPNTAARNKSLVSLLGSSLKTSELQDSTLEALSLLDISPFMKPLVNNANLDEMMGRKHGVAPKCVAESQQCAVVLYDVPVPMLYLIDKSDYSVHSVVNFESFAKEFGLEFFIIPPKQLGEAIYLVSKKQPLMLIIAKDQKSKMVHFPIKKDDGSTDGFVCENVKSDGNFLIALTSFGGESFVVCVNCKFPQKPFVLLKHECQITMVEFCSKYVALLVITNPVSEIFVYKGDQLEKGNIQPYLRGNAQTFKISDPSANIYAIHPSPHGLLVLCGKRSSLTYHLWELSLKQIVTRTHVGNHKREIPNHIQVVEDCIVESFLNLKMRRVVFLRQKGKMIFIPDGINPDSPLVLGAEAAYALAEHLIVKYPYTEVHPKFAGVVVQPVFKSYRSRKRLSRGA